MLLLFEKKITNMTINFRLESQSESTEIDYYLQRPLDDYNRHMIFLYNIMLAYSNFDFRLSNTVQLAFTCLHLRANSKESKDSSKRDE